MPRSKTPEQTVERILAVAETLFIQQGYEKTTMQDILAQLKLSKGAIYHHFKSKEEILHVIMQNWNAREVSLLLELAKKAQGRTAKEKIQNLFSAYFVGVEDLYAPEMELVAPVQVNSAQFSVLALRTIVLDVAPIFAKLLEEGVEDGSLNVPYPLEYAEIATLLFGFWTKPMLFGRTAAQTKSRLLALRTMFAQLQLDIFTQDMMEHLLALYGRLGFFDAGRPPQP